MTKILVVFSGSLSFCEDLGNSFFSIFCRPKSCGCVTVWESGHVRTFVCLVQDIYLFPQAGEHFSSFVYFSLLGLTRLYKVGCQLSRRELQKMQSPISPGISCHIFTRTDPDLNVIKHPFASRQGGTKCWSAEATLHENLSCGRKSWPQTYAVLSRISFVANHSL